MEAARAPDLITPVVAFRAWRMIDGKLLSPYIPCRWEGREMHADCRCGIYAYHRPGTQTYFGEWEWTEGIVTAWGRIEAHATGLRAQHARVEALGLPPSNEPTRRRSVETIAD